MLITRIILNSPAEDGLPVEDGEYLVCTNSGYMNVVGFSTTYQKFNTYRSQSPAEAANTAMDTDEIIWWAFKPGTPEAED